MELQLEAYVPVPAREVVALENTLAQTRFICEDLRDKISSEKEILKKLRHKIKRGYEYIKPESHDLKGKKKMLMDRPKSRKRTSAFKVLEDIQILLDKFNAVRHDLGYSMKVLKNFNSVYVRHLQEFENCEKLYNLSKTGSKQHEIIQQGIVNITATSLPSFKWESQNWKSDAQDLLDRYDGLLLTTRFDELMGKFDKLVSKLV